MKEIIFKSNEAKVFDQNIVLVYFYRGPGGGGGGGGGGEFRPIIHYRDLDAPREPDDFL